MSKILINIVGNICSGKSTLVRGLKEKLPTANFYSIDEYQFKYKSSNATDNRAVWLKFIEDISKSDFAIVESTGASSSFNKLNFVFEKLNGVVFIVKISCKKEICHQRFIKRGSNNLQIATKFRIEDSLNHIENILEDTHFDFELDGEKPIEAVLEDFMKIFQRQS